MTNFYKQYRDHINETTNIISLTNLLLSLNYEDELSFERSITLMKHVTKKIKSIIPIDTLVLLNSSSYSRKNNKTLLDNKLIHNSGMLTVDGALLSQLIHNSVI